MELSCRFVGLCYDGTLFHPALRHGLDCKATRLISKQLWDLFQPKRLFSPHDGDGRYSEQIHVARMVSIMGPPPLEFLRRSAKSRLFWDEEGGCTLPFDVLIMLTDTVFQAIGKVK